MPKLNVEVVADTSSLVRGLGRATRSASSFQRRIGGLGRTSGAFGRGVASSSGALSKFGGALALTSGGFLAGAGVVAGFRAVIGKAAEYESSLNVLQAVTGATKREMKQASAAASKLGGDITLPATSAKDAAAAMTELAKGGLSIRDSMAAARGTLQLAAAAQIDGASAAQIQANALNQFGLKGNKAGVVADALANAANAASGEVIDMATALSYAGPVAAGVGENIGNTATAVALLAKNGILGDKAGTTLRTTIAALAHPSKQAKTGLKTLGIEAFDSSGKFKGFRAVIGQLHDAQGKLTKQQFASAAAIAFGREPLAGIIALASSGVGQFDKMRTAVTKQGGAADVAAAHNKGFQGALDGLKSALDTVEISLGQQLLPTLTKYLRHASAWLGNTRNQQTIQHVFKGTLQAVATVMHSLASTVQLVDKVTGSFKNTMIALTAAFVAFKAVKVGSSVAGLAVSLAGSTGRVVGFTKALVGLARTEGAIGALSAAFPKLTTRAILSRKALGKAGVAGALVLVAVGAELAAKKIEGLQKQQLGAESRTAGKGKLQQTLVPNLAKQVKSLKAHGVSTKDILARLRKQLGGSLLADDLIGEAFRYSTKTGKSQLDKKLFPKLDESAKKVAAKTRQVVADVVKKTPQVTAAQKAALAKKSNDLFDAVLDARLGRLDQLPLQGQLAALAKISSRLTARIGVTKDITRKLNLEQKLFDVSGQRKDIQKQLAQRIIDKRTARQFRELGLTAAGEQITPGVANLKKRLGSVSKAVQGSFLDTNKTKGVLARIRKVLSEGLVPKDVRAKLKEMLDGLSDELKNHQSAQQTKFRHVSSATVLAGLGLSPQQFRRAQQRIAQLGAGGTLPGQPSAAFAGAGALTIHNHTHISLDGKKVAKSTTSHQRKANKRRTPSRRGPFAGHQ